MLRAQRRQLAWHGVCTAGVLQQPMQACRHKQHKRQAERSPVVDDFELDVGPQRQARAVCIAGEAGLGPHPAAAAAAAAPPGLLLGARHAAPAALHSCVVFLRLRWAALLWLLAGEAAVAGA